MGFSTSPTRLGEAESNPLSQLTPNAPSTATVLGRDPRMRRNVRTAPLFAPQPKVREMILGGLRAACLKKRAYLVLYIDTRAPHGCLPASMLRIGKYTSAPIRDYFFGSNISTSFDLSTNRIRSMLSGAGKRQCRVSALSFCICLTRLIIDQLLWHFLRLYLVYFQRSLKPKRQNRL